jgi:hypothetical protein
MQTFIQLRKTDYDTLMTAIYDTRLRGYWDQILVEEETFEVKTVL